MIREQDYRGTSIECGTERQWKIRKRDIEEGKRGRRIGQDIKADSRKEIVVKEGRHEGPFEKWGNKK